MIKSFFSAILLMMCFGGAAQNTDTIHWRSDYKLKWEDFQGIPDTTTNWGAITTTSFSYKIIIENGYKVVKTTSLFLKKSSWVRLNYVNIISLRHEQTHFDINELILNRFCLEIKQRKFTENTSNDEIKKIGDDYCNQVKLMEHDYDLETNYGHDEIKQDEWTKKINKSLIQFL